MNRSITLILLYTFLISVMTFNFAKGVTMILARSEKTLFGWFRIALGTLILGLICVLTFFLYSGSQS
jgi:hypothetical protein